MTDNELTMKLDHHLVQQWPVTIATKLPTLDEARAVIAADFSQANDLQKVILVKKS